MPPKRDTKIGRMRQYLEELKDKEFRKLNYEDDAKQAFSEIFQSDENYVDPDLYSPLLYNLDSRKRDEDTTSRIAANP